MNTGARFLATLLATACTMSIAAAPSVAWASPKAQPDFFVGYSGTHWQSDYDVLSGRCNRAAIGSSVASPVGAMIRARANAQGNRSAATLIGAAVDSLVAPKLGQELDEGDRACVGHALEIGKAGRRVSWDNGDTGVHYEVVPDEGHTEIAGVCRGFRLVAAASTGRSKRHGMACQRGPGLWQLTEL